MAIVKRLVKGSALTAIEHDANCDEFIARANHTGAQAISTVTGLQTALDGKAATAHTHPAAEISDSTVAGRTLLTAADAAAQRTALNVADGATANTGALADKNTVATADIDNSAVTYAKFQDLSASRLLGRGSSGTGPPQSLTLGTDLSFAGTVVNVDLTSRAALAGSTFTGLVQFSGTTHYGLKLIVLTTTERDALTPTGGEIIRNSTTGNIEAHDGTTWVNLGAGAGAAPALDDVTDVTITAPADNEVLAFNTGTAEWINQTAAEAGLAAAAHTHAATEISDSTAAGRSMLTAADAAAQTALLNAVTSTLKGLAPASGGGTTNFLRADGTWADPGAGASGTAYYNGTGGTLTKGTPVALAAFDVTAGNPGMAAADADGAGLMPCIGILGADVLDTNSGIPVISGGEITGLNTSSYTLGDRLYVSASGGLTATRPTVGFIQPVAVVSRVDAAVGEIIVVLEEAGELYSEVLMVAASDEATDLTTGTAKLTLWAPFAMTVTKIKANVITAPVGAALQVDVNEAGVSIFSTPITIDASEDTSETAAVAAVISDGAIANDAKITVDIDQIGSTTAGKGLKLTFYGYRT